MIKQKIAETFHEEPTDRFEIARHFQGLDVKSFLHYLLTLKEVHSRNELINFIKAIIKNIAVAIQQNGISIAKGLNPFDRSEGADPGHYLDESGFKAQVKNFLAHEFEIHELYYKDKYKQIYEELREFYSDRDITGTILDKNGFFYVPGMDCPITVIPNERLEDIKKLDPEKPLDDFVHAVIFMNSMVSAIRLKTNSNPFGRN